MNNRMYDNSPELYENAPAPVAAEQSSEQEIAAVLFGGQKPKPVVEPVVEGDDPGAVLFEPLGLYETAVVFEEGDIPPDVPEEVIEEARVEHMTTAAALQLSVPEVQQVATIARSLGHEPVTAETETRWLEETRAFLETRGEDAQSDLALAQKMISKFPNLKAKLDQTRLGNHPKIIELAIQRARSLRAAGKL